MATLTREQKKQLITELFAKHQALSELYDEAQSLFGLSIESKMGTVIWDVFEAWLKCVAERVGDTHKWLEWYLYENDGGAKGLEAGFDGDLKPIRTVDDLLCLIGD